MGGMGAIGGAQTCQYLALPPAAESASSTDLVAACVPLTPSGPGGIGDAGAGAPCKNSSECARGYCALTDRGSVCLAVCFVDGDCISNEMCRPQALAVGETVFSVLACR